MRLNAVETALMHNPVRTWLQRHYELPRLMQLGGDISGLRVLEIGCGRGAGTQLLIEQGRAGQVWAFDLDPAFVGQARARLSSWSGRRVQLTVADAEAIPAAAHSFDAVFDFGIIHHVPAWRKYSACSSLADVSSSRK
jgi:ubiquinone/menaquinone biosynthesis C-methylase UbiE